MAPQCVLPSTGEKAAFFSATVIRHRKPRFHSYLTGNFTIHAPDGDYEVDILGLRDLPNPWANSLHQGQLERGSVQLVFRIYLRFDASLYGRMVRAPRDRLSVRTTLLDGLQTIDTRSDIYEMGSNMPAGVMQFLMERQLVGDFLEAGDVFHFFEAYIPLGREVYAAGFYASEGGRNRIVFRSAEPMLTVCYSDPRR